MAHDRPPYLQLVVENGKRSPQGMIFIPLSPKRFRESGVEPLTIAIIRGGAKLLGSELESLQKLFKNDLDIFSNTCVGIKNDTVYADIIITIPERWGLAGKPTLGPRLKTAIEKLINAPIMRTNVGPDALDGVSKKELRSSLRSPKKSSST